MSKNGRDLMLRVGVAFAFVYPAISAFFNPLAWVGYFPVFVGDIIPIEIALLIFGVVEIVIAVWILFGKNIFVPSLIATVLLLAIVVVNWSQMNVVFRDIPIALMSLALALKYSNSNT